MFQIRDILKSAKTAAILAGIVVLLTPTLSFAAGESYNWADSSQKSIVASGGSYAQEFTLSESATDATRVIFIGQTTLTCNDQPTNTTVEADVPLAAYNKKGPAQATISVSPACPDAALASSAQIGNPASASTQQSQTCDQGSFSWLVCPLTAKITSAVSTIGEDVLTPLLRVQPLSQTSTPGLYQAWSNIKAFSEILFVLVFMVTLVASIFSVGLDSYTIKRILPRIVGAAILLQFSFLICTIAVDVGNVLGGGVQDLILSGFQASATHPDTSVLLNLSLITGGVAVGATALSFIITVPLLLIILFSVVAFFLTLAARYILIAVLVAISPLAVLAWVLPNTEQYFKQWYTTLIRLILMYPIIIAILAIGRRVTEIFSFTSDTSSSITGSVLVDILKPLIVVAIFLTIPRTFKWAGGLMNTASVTFNNLAKQGQTRVKDSQWNKDAQANRKARQQDSIRRLTNSAGVTSLTNSKSAVGRSVGRGFLGAAGVVMAGAPSNPRALQNASVKSRDDYAKELEQLPNGGNPSTLKDILTSYYGATQAERSAARGRLQTNAPEMLRYADTVAGRAAAVKRLDEFGSLDDKVMNQVLAARPKEYGEMKRAAGKSFSKIPAVLARYAEGELDDKGVRHSAGDYNIGAIEGITKSLTGAKLRDDYSYVNFEIAQTETQVAKAIADSASAGTFGAGFKPGASQMDQKKRDELVKMIEKQKHLFATGNGQQVRDSVIDGIASDEAYLEHVGEVLGITGWSRLSASQREMVLKIYLS